MDIIVDDLMSSNCNKVAGVVGGKGGLLCVRGSVCCGGCLCVLGFFWGLCVFLGVVCERSVCLEGHLEVGKWVCVRRKLYVCLGVCAFASIHAYV